MLFDNKGERVMNLVCSYLEIKVAFELLRLAQTKIDIFLIYGENYRIKTIDNCPNRYYFNETASIELQLNLPQEPSKIISSFQAIYSGKDCDFIFVPENNCPLTISIKRQRHKYPFIERLLAESENELEKASLNQ